MHLESSHDKDGGTMTLKLTIIDKQKIKVFQSIFQLLKGWGSNVHLIFNKDQLFIQGMDTSHVTYCNIVLTRTWFDTYDFEEGSSDVILCFDCNILNTVLSYAVKQRSLGVYIEHDITNTASLDVQLLDTEKTEKKTDFNRYFEIPLYESELELLALPDIEYDADFTINTEKFSELLSELFVFGTTLNILCSESMIELNANGEMGKIKTHIPIDDLAEFSISEGEELDLSFSLNYINKLCLSTKLSTELSISISKEYPLKMNYALSDDNSSRATFHIAAKVKDD